MKIIRQDIDALNADLKVQVAPEDYQGKVKSTLEKYRKTAKIPGFRPGNVPMSLIEKQYGKTVLADELNKLVNDSLYAFIQENSIEILGNPIPKEGADVVGDFEKPSSFEFDYQIGLTPQISIPLTDNSTFDYVKVKIDDSLIGKQIEDLRRRYGKLSSAQEVIEKDMVLAQFVELNDDGSIKEGGIMHSSTISMEFVEDSATAASLLGKKVADKITVNPSNVSRGAKDTAAMLGIKEEDLSSISTSFQMTITDIKRMELADLNQEFYDKLFGEGVVTSEKELKEKMSEDLGIMFANDSDRLLTRSIYENLLDMTNVELPNAFLKRWIKLSNEKPITDEQIEADYDGYSKSLKWQLIQGNIFKTNNIKLDNQEAISFTKDILVSNYAQYGIPAPDDKMLTKSAMEVLQNKEEATRIFDMLAESKLTNYFKSTVKLTEKEVSYDDFVVLASK